MSKYVQMLKLTLVDWLPFQPDMFIRWVPGEKQSTNSIGGSFPNLQEKKPGTLPVHVSNHRKRCLNCPNSIWCELWDWQIHYSKNQMIWNQHHFLEVCQVGIWCILNNQLVHIVHIESKPRQVLQTLLTMYRCSSRVLAEPEAGLPTKCSTDHISCFETSHSKKGTLSLNRKLACFEKNANLLVSLFLIRYVEACASVKENFVLRVERLLENSSVRRGPTGLKCRHLSSSLLFHYFK